MRMLYEVSFSAVMVKDVFDASTVGSEGQMVTVYLTQGQLDRLKNRLEKGCTGDKDQ